VGKHIFERVLGPAGCLKAKTRVLVTHGVTFLPQMDQIIVLKQGAVSEVGTYRELLEQKGAFADFLIQYLSEKGTTDADIVDAVDAESADVVMQIKQELESRIGTAELDRQLSRARTESECRSDSVGGVVASSQRRGSDESTRSGGALSNRSDRSSPRKQMSTTSPARHVSGEHSRQCAGSVSFCGASFPDLLF
jgi:ABC-type sulfate/molybdate transport systems ATPase subunit